MSNGEQLRKMQFLTKIIKDFWPEAFNSYLEAHYFVQQGCFFLSLFSCNFNDQLSPNFHRLVILCICWDTPSENTGL